MTGAPGRGEIGPGRRAGPGPGPSRTGPGNARLTQPRTTHGLARNEAGPDPDPAGHVGRVQGSEKQVKSRGRHAQRAGREAHIKPGPQGRAEHGGAVLTRRSRVGWDGAARNGRRAGVGDPSTCRKTGARITNVRGCKNEQQAGFIAADVTNLVQRSRRKGRRPVHKNANRPADGRPADG